jgi:hypothetical protein
MTDEPLDPKEVLPEIEYALRQALPLVVRAHRPLNARMLAEKIVEHLELSRIRFRRLPPAPKHTSDHYMGAPKVSTPELRQIARAAYERALAVPGTDESVAIGAAVSATRDAAPPNWTTADALEHFRRFVAPIVAPQPDEAAAPRGPRRE